MGAGMKLGSDIKALAKMGREELMRMAIDDELTLDTIHVALRGFGVFLKAVARGDVRGDDAARACMAKCQACASCTAGKTVVLKVNGKDAEVAGHYCGEPVKPHMESVLPTCGCAVFRTVDGIAEPRGKTQVGSERCPQGKW